MKRFLKENGLSIFLLAITIVTLSGQILTGWHSFNEELSEFGRTPLSLTSYLTSGHCLEAVFENWESEFLQMGLYVLLTVRLYQKGSAESKSLSGREDVDREPDATRKDAPVMVRLGGWYTRLYQNSLSIAYLLLFSVSFFLHALGGVSQYNAEQRLKGHTDMKTLAEFMSGSDFWFQSLQNWQSEFLSVLSIVVLTIYLRQKGSPESKPVDAPHKQTGK